MGVQVGLALSTVTPYDPVKRPDTIHPILLQHMPRARHVRRALPAGDGGIERHTYNEAEQHQHGENVRSLIHCAFLSLE